MYSLPQEIEVWYIIPAIRRELAQALIKKHKLNYEQAGKILGISKAAISQYLHKKRAKGIRFPEKIKKEMEKASDRIMKNNQLIVKEIMNLISLAKQQGIACQACKKYNKGILKICSARPIMEIR